jgi:phosphoribosylformylglycinamidine synthase
VKSPGNLIYLIGQTHRELGGSEYYLLRGFTGKTVPKVKAAQAKRTINSLVKAVDSGYVKSCHDLSEGGLAVAVAEMAFSGGYGIQLDLRSVPRAKDVKRNDYVLFSESNSRFLVEVPEKRGEDFEALMGKNVYSAVGRVEKNRRLSVYGLNGERVVNVSLSRLRNAWKSTFGG